MMRYVLLRFPQFRNKAVTLSYDDASIWDEKLVSIMNGHGLKGTFNINSSWLGKQGHLTVEQAKALYLSSGHEIAVHGVDHLTLTEVSTAIATREILMDRIELEKIVEKPVLGMAYANGGYSDEVVQIVKQCGIRYARTTIATEKFDIPEDWLRMPTTCHHNNPRLMALVEEFLREEENLWYWARKPKLFSLWGHSHEFARNNNWQVIEEFAAKIGDRQDVWYATNGELYEYTAAFRSLIFAADGSFVYNPSTIDIYLDYLGKEKLVRGGELARL